MNNNSGLNEKLGLCGLFEINIRSKTEDRNKIIVIKNRIMNVILNAFANAYIGTPSNFQVKYLAVGSSSAAVTDTDTILGNEIFRTQVTSQTRSGTGEASSDFVLLSTEANFNIKEIGIFGGTLATSTAGTGTLISRVLWDYTKTSSEEISIKRIDKIVRG